MKLRETTTFDSFKGNRVRIECPDYVDSDDLGLPDNAMQVLKKRYLRRDENGEALETPAGMFYRVAATVANAGQAHYTDEVMTRRYFDLMTERRFYPNSPTFTGASTPLGQLAACFVLKISDDLGKEDDGIFNTLRTAALIQQTGGGNGFSLGEIRPKNSTVNSTSGIATGPMGFLEVYDKAFGVIAQGGSRRGANMAVMPVSHPDIEEFIACKNDEGKIANFNISVGISDEFMRCVESGKPFDLVNPHTGEKTKTINAAALFVKIAKQAHKNGEPGVLFLDAANRFNPVPHLYELAATNPCGEQFLGPNENCCLGSINLAAHAIYVNGEPAVDWRLLVDTIVDATCFLDSVVTVNKYVPSIPKIKEAALLSRRIGLGIMGLADLMYHMGIRYGSEAGQEFAAQIMEFVRYHCMLTSIQLASELGTFRGFKGSIYDSDQPGGMQWNIPRPLSQYKLYFGRPKLNWAELRKELVIHGIRNAAQTTIAPTGTIATVCGTEGYGCEPVFALSYSRNMIDGDKKVVLNYVSPLFEKALDRTDISPQYKRLVLDSVAESGTCQDLRGLPDAIRNTFVTSADITAEEHVRMQAALQAFVDNSISKTINFPGGATELDVAKAYQLAWELGCKGLTVYITGSRKEVVLETKATKEAKTTENMDQTKGQPMGELVSQLDILVNGIYEGLKRDSDRNAATPEFLTSIPGTFELPQKFTHAYDVSVPSQKKTPRPSELNGKTYREQTGLGKAYLTINSDDSLAPLEFFLNVGKAGSAISGISEAMGRLISMICRMPSSVPAIERLRWVAEELAGVGGRPVGFGATRSRSLPDAIAHVLTKHTSEFQEQPLIEEKFEPLVEDNFGAKPARAMADVCPECGEATLLNIEGCLKCDNPSCGYSAC